jgi:hypothetical protein
MKILQLTLIVVPVWFSFAEAQTDGLKEKNAVLVNRYVAALNSRQSSTKISVAKPDLGKYVIQIRNVKFPSEYTYSYFHMRTYPRGILWH